MKTTMLIFAMFITMNLFSQTYTVTSTTYYGSNYSTTTITVQEVHEYVPSTTELLRHMEASDSLLYAEMGWELPKKSTSVYPKISKAYTDSLSNTIQMDANGNIISVPAHSDKAMLDSIFNNTPVKKDKPMTNRELRRALRSISSPYYYSTPYYYGGYSSYYWRRY